MTTLREKVQDLEQRRARAKEMGGADRIDRQHARGKLTVRERVERLFDAGTFLELGIHASETKDPTTPADGVVTGVGRIDGRLVALAGYDFTVRGGTMGEASEVKVTRMREIALRDRIPMVWLVDSGGARIDPSPDTLQRIPAFADTGYLFREQVVMSGVVPQVAAMVGPGAAGTAYIPGLADFVPMVKGTSSMALGGPPLVKAAVGEDVTAEDLGGSSVHNAMSGCADLEVDDDDACLRSIRTYLSYFPSSCDERPPRREDAPGPQLLDDAVLDLLPDDARRSWDMHKLLPMLVDPGSLFEIKAGFARSLVTTLARIGGYSVGIVANNPKHLGGILDADASYKAAHFVNLCDAFQIPLVFLVDVPGFIVGTHAERTGIIRHGAQMLYAVARATVPKFTVILRRAYGAGYYVMCGRAFEPDLLVAWPSAEIAIMGAAGMVSIGGEKLLVGSPDPDAMRAQMMDAIQGYIDPYEVARRGWVDDVIDPRETRNVLLSALELTRNKQILRPPKRHGVAP